MSTFQSLVAAVVISATSFPAAISQAVPQFVDRVNWVNEKQNPQLWADIRKDFHDELQADDPARVAPVMAYSYKYIYRVAMYQGSALVVIGHLETKNSKYPGYYSAFNYDVRSHVRTVIKGVEVVSAFKFVKFASLDPAAPQDIVFTWMTCTECEASEVLSAFHYDAGKNAWTLRNWEANKDIWWTTEQGPVIWSDVSASDTISFDCVHGFLASQGDHSFAIRCHEVAEPEGEKRTTTDITAKYNFSGDSSKLEIVRGGEKKKVLTELCMGSPRNKLCSGIPIAVGKQ